MAKITIIGAGSVTFAKNIIFDLLSYPELSGSTISLMDIDIQRLNIITKLAKKMIVQENFKAEIESTTDRRKALKSANYVIAMIQVGGLEASDIDISIPLKYGINQAVGDTMGPGGVFRGLRTIPVFLDIARDMEELCPDAIFINYVNPMAINCWAMNRASGVRTVGLCHSVQFTAEGIAGSLGVPYEEVSYRSAGINHQAWFIEFKHKGRDLYPMLKEKYYDPGIYKNDVTRFEFLKYFGYFVTESSIHMSEYVPFFRKSREWMNKIHEAEKQSNWGGYDWSTPDNCGVYLKVNKEIHKTYFDDMWKMLEENKVKVSRSNEYGASIVHAMETGEPEIIHGNVDNTNLITNLPQGCCVEIPCLVDRNGVQPTYIGKLTTQLAALNRTNINVQELTVEGALTANKDAIYQAVMMDPLTSTMLTLPDIHAMVTEMFEAQKDYLTGYKWK